MNYPDPSKIILNERLAPLMTGPLFLSLEQCKKRIIICQGGGDAGKTITILCYLAVKAIQMKRIQVTVVGIDVPNLRRGAMKAFKKYVANDPQIAPFIDFYHKTDREYHFRNGSIISFVSFEDDEDARGAEHNFVFMNESNLMGYNLFWELQRKCRNQIICDYNPSFAYWAHSKLINGGEAQFVGQVQLFIVDHRHNPFLTEEEHAAYESISDPERFLVYARGMTGKTKGAIFNFKRVEKIPTRTVIEEDGTVREELLPFGFGMDIGYTTDKTTIVKVYMDGKDHYYQELLYKSNDEIQNEINELLLTDAKGNAQTVEGYIRDILVANGMTSSSMLWGDHDKVISAKLRRIQVPYRMAKKGPNSVVASIQSVKRFNGFYFDSPNLENELKSFVWQTAIDQLTGNEVSTSVPKDDMPDHCFIGSTLIRTNKGLVKISDIKKGDLVLTSQGFNKVNIHWKNGVQLVNNYRISLDSEIISLTCTPNHLIKTNVGWIQISKLQSGMMVSLSNTSMESPSNFTQMKNISILDPKKCTRLFGNTITAKLKKASTFITKMAIHGIISPKTLSLFQPRNTFQSMAKSEFSKIQNGFRDFVPPPLLQQMNGRKLQKEEKVCEFAEQKEFWPKKITAAEYAVVAEKNFSESITTLDFVTTTASKNSDEIQALTKNYEHVIFAEHHFIQKSKARQGHVVKDVQVTEAGHQEVYDLTVDSVHEYYANELLVHNCIAAIRYFDHSYSMRFTG